TRQAALDGRPPRTGRRPSPQPLGGLEDQRKGRGWPADRIHATFTVSSSPLDQTQRSHKLPACELLEPTSWQLVATGRRAAGPNVATSCQLVSCLSPQAGSLWLRAGELPDVPARGGRTRSSTPRAQRTGAPKSAGAGGSPRARA